jgi:hypothetical protein
MPDIGVRKNTGDTTIYNEIDPQMAGWINSLIEDGCIREGNVDARDIRDIKPVELMGYQRAHFFAGIGGKTPKPIRVGKRFIYKSVDAEKFVISEFRRIENDDRARAGMKLRRNRK